MGQKQRSLIMDDKDKIHDLLFSDATQKLAQIHQTLLRSERIMDGKRWNVKTGPINYATAVTQ